MRKILAIGKDDAFSYRKEYIGLEVRNVAQDFSRKFTIDPNRYPIGFIGCKCEVNIPGVGWSEVCFYCVKLSKEKK